MPVYIVKVPGNPPTERLVDAPNQASARGHVARKVFEVEVAKGADLFRLAKAGTELEVVNDPAAPLAPGEQITSTGHTGGPGDKPPAEDDQPKGGKSGK